MADLEGMRQVGVIMYGSVLNKEVWIEDAKKQGYTVVDKGDYAELYIKDKKR